jgi:hypothetical protein
MVGRVESNEEYREKGQYGQRRTRQNFGSWEVLHGVDELYLPQVGKGMV